MVPPTRLGALSLSILQTLLVFAGIPLGVVVLVYAVVYGTSSRRSSKRYRPGRPFTFTPVWFLAAEDKSSDHGTAAAALPASERAAQLPAGPLPATRTETTASHGQTGGASDRW